MAQATPSAASKVAQIVTDKIIAAIEENQALPWSQPWKCAAMPCNALTGRAYRGINALLLSLAPYADHRYLTMKQVNDCGGKVRAGEKSTLVTFWRWPDKKVVRTDDDAADEFTVRRSSPSLMYYLVFNVEQCDGLDSNKIKPLSDVLTVSEFTPDERAEAVLEAYQDGPKVTYGGVRACYTPTFDKIQLPNKTDFTSVEGYYSTVFHEHAHGTGHATRLNRPGVTNFDNFGSHQYSKEELVAELSAAFLCAECGLDRNVEQSAAYIQSWLNALNNDKNMIVYAAAQAQKATDWISNRREAFAVAESEAA